MSDKYIRTLRRMALDGSLDAKTATVLLQAHDAGRFVESEHPRGKGGKFVKKGSGGSSGGSSSGSSGGGKSVGPSFETGKKAHESLAKISSSKDLNGKVVILENENGRRTILKESKKYPNEFDARFYSPFSVRGVEGGMNMLSFKHELKRVDPSKTTIMSNSLFQRKELDRANLGMSEVCKTKANEWPEGSHERDVYLTQAKILSQPLSGRPTKKQSQEMTNKFLSNISDQLKPYAVDRYKKDLANEPQITNDICDIADELGAGMFGLDYRLKKASNSSDGVCRIAEKIDQSIAEARKNGKEMSYEEAVDGLGDLVRYTQACTTGNLTENVDKTIAALEKKGYKCVKCKNTWDSYNESNPYRGVNCAFISPTGTRFELQFHTPESLVCKEVQHGWYEEARAEKTSEERRKELNALMYQNAQGMTAPKDIRKLMNIKL